MNEYDQYIQFLQKIRERLTILFDHHLVIGRPIIESDRDLFAKLYDIYYDGCLPRLGTEPPFQPEPEQTSAFLTTTLDLFGQDDAEKLPAQ